MIKLFSLLIENKKSLLVFIKFRIQISHKINLNNKLSLSLPIFPPFHSPSFPSSRLIEPHKPIGKLPPEHPPIKEEQHLTNYNRLLQI
jgi:hypothetical protein